MKIAESKSVSACFRNLPDGANAKSKKARNPGVAKLDSAISQFRSRLLRASGREFRNYMLGVAAESVAEGAFRDDPMGYLNDFMKIKAGSEI